MPGPSPSAHQVLVYSGPGVSPLSLSHTLLTLRLLLLPHYTVQPVTPDVLYSQPWEPSCALLVFPGGRDLPYVEELTSKRNVTKRIKKYVAEGGRYLGICAGGYFGSDEVRFDVGGPMEVTGKRDLAFFPGSCVGPVFEGFEYASEAGSRAVAIVLKDSSLDHIYYNGGGHFVLSEPVPENISVLAHFADPSGTTPNPIAAVLTKIGQGSSVLCSVHPEYPLSDPPARDAILRLEHQPTAEEVAISDKARTVWVEDILVALGLKPPGREAGKTELKMEVEEDPSLLLHPTHPSPIFLLSHPNLPQLPAAAVSKPELKGKMRAAESWQVLRDGNDEIHFGTLEATADEHVSEDSVAHWLATARRTEPVFEPSVDKLSMDDSTPQPPSPPDFHSLPKYLILPPTTKSMVSYSPRWTPLFNFSTYWSELDLARKRTGRRSGVLRPSKANAGEEQCSLGDLVLYAETVTSTQTMLDANPLLLSHLPPPVAFLASFQLSGRGRGSNIWLSPPGCLQFSLLLDLPEAMSGKMVFIQYLVAIAVCEAVDEDGRLGVRVKWPNDIYAECDGVGGTTVGGGTKGRAKLGGILVNTSFVGGRWKIVVGCGINVLNALPTTSLSQLHSILAAKLSSTNKSLPAAPTMEGTFARIMCAFDAKWEQFLEEGGFKGFMDEYHGRWLHSGQEVTLTTTDPHTPLRVLSITPDYGLLRCITLKQPQRSANGLTPLYGRDVDAGEDDRGSWSARPSATGSSSLNQFVDLQPDGNSFDLMSGLIKRKT